MKNVSKNAVQAISLDGKMYLAHKSVENFSLGAGDFTIEVFFICNSITDCCFYAQEQGFEFGIKDGCLYFDLEGVGSIKQNEEISLETDALYFAAVSCKDGALSLYFEGFPVAEIAEVKPAGVENTGNFIIGKGLDGYIVEVRLRSCGMNDQEILHDCGMGLQDCDSIEFWSDFTTVQYKDKSSNALLLWTNEGIVLDVNASSCTQLSSKGGFATITRQSYTSGYTLLFKIFPRLENNNTMYIYSVISSEGKTVFSVGLQSDNEGYKHIFVEHNGASYLGESTLPLAQWIDVALRIESTEAKVYIDGTDELSFPFSGELTNITAMIGIKPFTKKVSFKNSFDGYLDYFAEFECALEADKIDFYAEEQPYIFDDSIRTLYAFYCGEPTDLASGGTMYKVGQSKALFVKNLNDLDAPIGMDFRVPQEVCAEWLELDEYEQWAMTTAMDMVREVYSQSMGYTIPEGIVPIEQAATKSVMKLFEEEIYLSKTVWPPEEEEVIIKDFIEEATMKGVGGKGMAVACGGATAVVATAGAVVTGAVTGGKAVTAVESVMVTGGACAILVVTLAKVENDSKKKKPKDKDGQVELISVCCNHEGNPVNGSIHFHSDVDLTGPEDMVYENTDNFSIDMLLVTNKIENLRVICVLRNNKKEPATGIFGLKCGVFYALVEQEITIPPNAILEVSLYIQLKKKDYNALAKYLQDGWQFYFNEFVICYCTANVYLQKDLPIAPWDAHIGQPYNRNIKEYPSLYFTRTLIIGDVPLDEDFGAEVRDVLLQGEVKQQFNELLQKIFNSKRLGYVPETQYVKDFNIFDLRRFLTDMYYYQRAAVNCTDCANIVSLIAATLGITLGMNIITGYNEWNENQDKDIGFKCNGIAPMPDDTWIYGIFFSYHQVAFYNVDDEFSKNAEIYDLSLKIDKGGYPGGYTDKEPFLSGGYKAYESSKMRIEVREPYNEEVYLERLIQNNQAASYFAKYFRTKFDFNNNMMKEKSEPYAELMQRFIQFYGLDNEKYAVEMSQPEMKLSFLQKMNLEKRSESPYECEWSAPDGMRVKWFRNAEHLPAGEYLASVLMRFSCHLEEKEALELGERAFYGPDLLITYFGGSAYLIKCKDMEKAEEMAHNLKSSMIQ